MHGNECVITYVHTYASIFFDIMSPVFTNSYVHTCSDILNQIKDYLKGHHFQLALTGQINSFDLGPKLKNTNYHSKQNCATFPKRGLAQV
jgi:hypothetical protein